MSVTNKAIFSEKHSKINEKQFHQNTLKCLKDCSNYSLSISYNQRKEANYSFFSKIIRANKNNIFIFNHLSPNEIIRNISENSMNNDAKNLNSCFLEKMIDIGDNNIDKVIENEIINIPLEAEKLTYNFLDSSKYTQKFSSHRGINLLIKFDLNEDKLNLVLDKNILYNIFVYKINAKLHGGKDLFEKDLFFLLDIKKIVKSIQVRLEFLQKQEKSDREKIGKLFVPLLEYENIGLIVSPSNESSPLYYGVIKTNFNSIVKLKFKIKSVFTALNISTSNKRKSLNIENVYNSNFNFLKKNIENIKNKNIDCITDETTSESSNYNSTSPKISQNNDNVYIDNIEFININEPLNNSCILLENNLNNNYFNLNCKNIDENNANMVKGISHYYKTKKCDLFNTNKKTNHSSNLLYNLSNTRNKYSSYQTNYNINTIIINSNDIFLKTLFNRYQDKSNSTCNLKILIEFLKIKMKKFLSELTIYDFFCSFYKVSSLSLKIPFFKNDGSLIQNTLTPSLHELNLNIKNSKIVQKFIKKFNIKENIPNSSSTIQSEEDLIVKDIDEFKVSICEKESLVRIYFKEQKPYYLTESLFDKLEVLINKLKYIKKLSIDKNVLLDKSYIGIEWNIINGNNIFSSSFISYHLFNGDFLGILVNIKEKENNFWINSIEEFNNNRIKVEYNYIIEENYFKVVDFINKN